MAFIVDKNVEAKIVTKKVEEIGVNADNIRDYPIEQIHEIVLTTRLEMS